MNTPKLLLAAISISLSLTSCGGGGGGGGAGSSGKSLPEASRPVYDFRNYAPEYPVPAEVDGFWLVLCRMDYHYQYENSRGFDPDYTEAIFEKAFVVSIQSIEGGYRIVSWMNNLTFGSMKQERVIFRDTDSYPGQISFAQDWLGYFNLEYDGTNFMQGEFTLRNPESGSGWAHVDVKRSELHAVKLGDFPEGVVPDDYGQIVMPESLTGYYDVTLSVEEGLDAGDVDNMSGNIAYFDISRLTGRYVDEDGVSTTIDTEHVFLSGFWENGRQGLRASTYFSYPGQYWANAYIVDDSVPVPGDSHTALLSSASPEMEGTYYDLSTDWLSYYQAEFSLADAGLEESQSRGDINGSINIDLSPWLVAE